MKKKIIVGILFLMLVSTMLVSAKNFDDETGDVGYYEWIGGTSELIRDVDDKPDLDITEVSYQISDGKITISLQVLGTIKENENIGYNLQFISEEARYTLHYENGEELCMGESYLTDEVSFENVTISGGTISCTFDWYGETATPTGQIQFQGSVELSVFENGDEVAFYDDNVIFYEDEDEEEEESDEITDGESDDDSQTDTEDGTPGFELVLVLCAIAVALLILRKKRKT